MSYDASRGRMVVVASNSVASSTWELDVDGVANWIQRSPGGSPPDAVDGALAYDEAREVTVHVAGTRYDGSASLDVFEYATTIRPEVNVIGASCQGAQNFPVCVAASLPLNLPWIGTSFTIEVTGMGPGNVLDLFFGTSLVGPYGLGVIGLPSCNGYTDNFASQQLTADASGVANYALTIPNNPLLAGFRTYVQAYTLGTSLYDSTSNALELVVQSK
jgi:hypothetical protein